MYLFSFKEKMLRLRFKDDSVIEIGIDEAGRGSFWGPIMAGACILPFQSELSSEQIELLDKIRDSKKITAKKREIIAVSIQKLFPRHSIGIVNADEINEYGISWANQEAFRRAIHGLGELGENRLLMDGILKIPDWNGEQNLIIEGDNTYLAIAAASILAKVAHDKWVTEYCTEHLMCDTKYDLIKSKGYGTKNHREGIKTYGAHELHRALYIQKWLPESENQVIKEKRVKNKTSGTMQDNCLIRF
jgi:ribonuclease HII